MIRATVWLATAMLAASAQAQPITTAAAMQARLHADAVVPLWGEDRWAVPQALQGRGDFAADPGLATRAVAHPQLFVFRPARPNGRVLIAVPGGGYRFVSVDNEGLALAQRFVPWGYTVAVLVYRLPSEGWAGAADVALADAQRAVRLVRAQARAWQVDPHQVGVVGFSAGGQLAGDLATAFDRPVYEPRDAADALSARPDLAALIYPVVLLEPPYTHTETAKALGGPDHDAAALARHSAAAHVGAATPPLFLLHAEDDGTVACANSVAMASAMAAAHRPVELHLVPTGGHGFGDRVAPERLLSGWTTWLRQWWDRYADPAQR